MPAIINFGIFETQELADSEVNFGLSVSSNPTLHAKINQGYGFNVGDVKFVPSYALLLDMDVLDIPRWTPFVSQVSNTAV